MSTSTRDPLFDPRISEWLEADPNHAPTEILDVVGAALGSIEQRRGWWRGLGPTWSPAGRLVAFGIVAALLVGMIVVLASGSAPRPLPAVVPSLLASSSPSASASATTALRFASPRYGYSVEVGPDWKITPATLTWSGPDNSPPVMDDLQVTGTDSGFGVASEALQPGQTFDDWLVPFVEYGVEVGGLSNVCLGGPASTWPPVQVGDQMGRWQQMCNAAEVVVEAQGQAYVFALGSSTFDTERHLSDDAFKAILRTVQFDAAAVPTPEPLPPFERHDTSPRYGVTVSLPAGWTYTPATRRAANLANIQYGDPALDEWRTDTARLVVMAQQPDAEQTESAWLDAYCRLYHSPSANCDGVADRWPRIPVGDLSGWLDVDGNSMIGSVATDGHEFDAVVFHDGRAYTFTLDGLVDRPLFDAILAAIQFGPPGRGPSATP